MNKLADKKIIYKNYIVDAAGQSLGRVASRVAALLLGKRETTREKHLLPRTRVTIVNAAKLKLSPKKLIGKQYVRYSGYPGGLYRESLEKLIARRGASEPLRLAIYRMLPANKLRAKIIKQLEIK